MTFKFDPSDPANEQLNDEFLAAHPQIEKAIERLEALEHEVMNLDYQRMMIRETNREILDIANSRTLSIDEKEKKLQEYLAKTGKSIGNLAASTIEGIASDMDYNSSRHKYLRLRLATEKLIDAEMEAWTPENHPLETHDEANQALIETQPDMNLHPTEDFYGKANF